jgi:hypothetical protein
MTTTKHTHTLNNNNNNNNNNNKPVYKRRATAQHCDAGAVVAADAR